MDKSLNKCLRLIDEMQSEIDKLQSENMSIKAENYRLKLAAALLRYKPKRGRRPNFKQEEPKPSRKIGRPPLLPEDMRAKFPELIDKIKIQYSIKTDIGAIQQIFIEAGHSEWRAKSKAKELQVFLSKERGKISN